MFCNKCGKVVGEGERFCRNCGALTGYGTSPAGREDQWSGVKTGKMTEEDLYNDYYVDMEVKEPQERVRVHKGGKLKIVIVPILLLLLAAGGFFGIKYYTTYATVKEQMSLGNKYLSEGKYEEAILAFNKVIEIQPRNMEAKAGLKDAYTELAKDYKKQLKIADAKEILKKGIKETEDSSLQKMLNEINAKIRIETEQKYNDSNYTIDYYLHAFNDKGDKLWTREWLGVPQTEGNPPLEYTVYNYRVLVEAVYDLYAIDQYTGNILWDVQDVGACGAPLVDTEGNIYVTGYFGPFMTAVTQDGKVKWQKNFEEFGWTTNPRIVDDYILVDAHKWTGYDEHDVTCTLDKNGNLVKDERINSGNYQAQEASLEPDAASESDTAPTIVASSYLKEDIETHYPANICDGNVRTAWVEGAEGDGLGESILIDFGKEKAISSLDIINGFAKEERLYYANHRVKRIMISFSDGRSQEFDLQDKNLGYQTIQLHGPVKTSFIKLTILGIYCGTKYSDTCISEVRIN